MQGVISLLDVTSYDKLYYIWLNKEDTNHTVPGLYLILENIDNFIYKLSQILNVNRLSETILAVIRRACNSYPVPMQNNAKRVAPIKLQKGYFLMSKLRVLLYYVLTVVTSGTPFDL